MEVLFLLAVFCMDMVIAICDNSDYNETEQLKRSLNKYI